MVNRFRFRARVARSPQTSVPASVGLAQARPNYDRARMRMLIHDNIEQKDREKFKILQGSARPEVRSELYEELKARI